MFVGVLTNGKNCFNQGCEFTKSENLSVNPTNSFVKVFSSAYLNASSLVPLKPVSS
jgi:hypothetical protein